MRTSLAAVIAGMCWGCMEAAARSHESLADERRVEATPKSTEFLPFLRAELVGFGIAVPEPSSHEPDFSATVARDEVGFVVTAPEAAFPVARSFLTSVFGSPKFDHDPTMIFRSDARFTTLMLAHNGDDTQVIVMPSDRDAL